MLGYKIVEVRDGEYTSAVCKVFSVQYVIGQLTRPRIRNSPLFLFESLEFAKAWAGCGGVDIADVIAYLECEYEPWDGTFDWCESSSWFENAWHRPQGTVFASKCTPLRVVEPSVVEEDIT